MKTSIRAGGLIPGACHCLRWLALTCLMAGAANSALASKTFSDNGDGTVSDPMTGLIWMRCSLGQTWNANTSSCSDTASSYSWDQANALTGTVTFAGQSDWRVPNIRELTTITDRSRYSLAIDALVFPNTPTSNFWSASDVANFSNQAWFVFSLNGNTGTSLKSSSHQVRLVRSGQSSASLLSLGRPTTDYADAGDGTVTHTPTGLVWQRCVKGQSWTGSTCSGSATTYAWDTAVALTDSFAGKSDWRLPTISELESQVDYTASSPSANTTVFPLMSASNFWSASPHALYSVVAWEIGFYGGAAGGYDKSNANQVRFVRAGQLLNSYTLTVSKTGTGTISGSTMTGLSCGSVCSANYSSGTTVILGATPGSGGTFDGWSGACSGTASTCTVTMGAAQSVTANFTDHPLVSGLLPSLTFSNQVVGTVSTAQNATLSNIGFASLKISSIVASGDFAQTNDCGTTLVPGASCTLTITFNPSAAGTRTGGVTIVSNAVASPHSVSLSGVGLLAQTIGAISFSPSTLTLGGTTTASAIATSGLTVMFSSTTPTICSVSGGTVSTIAAGICTIAADQTGNGTYSAAPQVTQSITVNKVSQSIGTISFLPATLTVGGTTTASVTATSSLAVSLSITTPNICSISGSSVTGLAAGTCIVTANQAGNATYSAATQVTQSITVNKVSQTVGAISFLPTTLAVGGMTAASATATSGLAVTFSSTAPTICSVSGSRVTGLAAGICIVAADQGGNATYSASPQVTQSIVVNKVSQSIGTISFSPTILTVGSTTTASATATSGLAVTFSSSATPTICSISGSTVTGLATGTCTIAANQSGDGTYSAASQVTQNLTVSYATRLINLSTRGRVQAGDNVLIGGFIIQGNRPKTVVVRAVGPSLAAYSVSGALADPMLQIYSGQTVMASNDDWQTSSNVAAVQASGLAPANKLESAILTTLNPGAYTAIVSGVGEATGVAIIEVFEVDTPENPLINISTRGLVQTGDSVLIGGFIIQGDSAKTVLIRAGGPSLAAYRVPGVLANPRLDLYLGQSIIYSNDNWGDADNAAAIQATGMAPADPLESAILVTLQPGAYTAIVRGADGGSGVGIVEVFAR